MKETDNFYQRFKKYVDKMAEKGIYILQS